MKQYESGRIYKIYDVDDVNMFYIGSTAQPLSKRMAQHRKDAKKHPDRYFYKYFLSHNMKIELIELDDECFDKEKTLKKEAEKIEKKLNKKSFIITLEIEDKQLNSLEFANLIDKTMTCIVKTVWSTTKNF